jgi:hypothetical protein
MPNAERLLREDLEGASFLAGADRGWWRLHALSFPFAIIEIAAAARPNGPAWLALRMHVVNYPQAPSGQPWSLAQGAPLPVVLWPTGNERIQKIFNPNWRSDALYFPMDALALEGHDAWRTQHACHVWDPSKDITQYLRLVYELLNEDGYTGVRG